MKIKWLSLVRVIGLLLVLIYHFFPSALPGGFIGVDVFFVFSGYLITSLLIIKYRDSGKLSFISFIKRRFWRLYPSLVVMLLLMLPLSLFLGSDYRVDLTRQVSGVLSFTTNQYELFSGTGYEGQLFPHLFVHTWSLSIEMFSYILAGLGLSSLAIISKDSSGQSNKFRTNILIFSGFIALFSFGFMQWQVVTHPSDVSRAYFSTISHMFPFFIGSIVAVYFGIGENERINRVIQKEGARSKILGAILGAGIVLILLGVFLKFNNHATYRFGFLIASIATAIMIIGTRCLHGLQPNKNEPVMLRVLSDISYQIYLFHWPLYILFSNVISNNIIVSILAFFTSFGLAFVTHHMTKSLPNTLITDKVSTNGKLVISIGITVLTVISLVAAFNSKEMNSVEKGIIAGNQKKDITAIIDRRDKLAPDRAVPRLKNPTHLKLSKRGTLNVKTMLIGDSVPLGAHDELKAVFPISNLDAEISRNMNQGLAVFNQIIQEDDPYDFIIISLGLNEQDTGNWRQDLASMVNGVKKGQRLILVTPFNGGIDSSKVAVAEKVTEFERKIKNEFPFITLADWATIAPQNLDKLAEDKIHVLDNKKGRKLFTETIRDAVIKSSEGPAKDK